MTYTTALSFSWALTWRLALANLVLALILVVLLAAFGSPYRSSHALFLAVGNAALGWLLAWPFVVKRVLAPQQVFLNASLSNRFQIRYWAAVILGVVSDLASLIPMVAALLLFRLLGLRIPNPVALVIFSVVRLFAVLPFGLRRLFRQLPELA